MSHRARSSILLVVTALAALALSSGCATPGYDHTELDTTNADGTSTPLSSVVFQVGIAVELAAIPMSAGGPLGGDFTFDLASSDRSVLDIEPALGQMNGRADFVFIGVSSGDTQILVTLDDTLQSPIPVQVVPQTSP